MIRFLQELLLQKGNPLVLYYSWKACLLEAALLEEIKIGDTYNLILKSTKEQDGFNGIQSCNGELVEYDHNVFHFHTTNINKPNLYLHKFRYEDGWIALNNNIN